MTNNEFEDSDSSRRDADVFVNPFPLYSKNMANNPVMAGDILASLGAPSQAVQILRNPALWAIGMCWNGCAMTDR